MAFLVSAIDTTLKSCFPCSEGFENTSDVAITSLYNTPLYIKRPFVGKSELKGFLCFFNVSDTISFWLTIIVSFVVFFFVGIATNCTTY